MFITITHETARFAYRAIQISKPDYKNKNVTILVDLHIPNRVYEKMVELGFNKEVYEEREKFSKVILIDNLRK